MKSLECALLFLQGNFELMHSEHSHPVLGPYCKGQTTRGMLYLWALRTRLHSPTLCPLATRGVFENSNQIMSLFHLKLP